MEKHQKRFSLHLYNSSGLSNSAVEVVEYKNLIAFHGFLGLKETSAPDDLARSPFTWSLKAGTLTLSIIFWSCLSPLCWGRNDRQICCNLLAIAPPNPLSGVVGLAIDRCIRREKEHKTTRISAWSFSKDCSGVMKMSWREN